MKKIIILFIAAVTFFSITVTAKADKPFGDNANPSGYGFPIDCYCNFNMPGEHDNVFYPLPECAGRTQAFGTGACIPRDQGNDPPRGKVSL